MDDLLDDVTGLVGFFLVPESDESYKDVSNESSNDYEEKESENFQYISVLYGYILVPLRFTLHIFQLIDLQELLFPYSYKRPFQLVYFVLLVLIVIY